jgi:hypothetical protein
MLSDAMLQKALDVPLMDGVPLLISDQKYLCKEVIRLRSELARFLEGMPSMELLNEFDRSLRFRIVSSENHLECVFKWLRRLAAGGGE